MSIVEKMSKKLPDEWIKTTKMGNRPEMSYVPIDKVILNLNTEFKDNWNVTINRMDHIVLPTGRLTVLCEVLLTITEGTQIVTRSGVGSDTDERKDASSGYPDTDKLVKTAYANAVKKAANMFGFGAELWDEANVPDQHENAPRQSTSSNQQPTQKQQDQPKPAGLSEKSREKVSALLAETGLMRAELTDYLKEFYPASAGNPAHLTIGDEDANIDAFVQKVRDSIKSKPQ